MTPFDLEKALAGDEVVTRNGLKVTELHYFHSSRDYQKLCCIINGESEWFNDDGTYGGHCNENYYDLFMAKKIMKTWVNFYYTTDKKEMFCGGSHNTEEEAKRRAGKTISDGRYIKTVCVTDEVENDN